VLTYDFRLPPGPRTVEYAPLAEDLGFRAVWCPEIPAFGHDIWVTLARIAEETKRIKFGPSVLIPSYRHPTHPASHAARQAAVLGLAPTSCAADAQCREAPRQPASSTGSSR
jgi:alkanesulfonate monooxygenase SsuD/methylene tetrahydromethanopterin reductase-like flavin-dependent oxidoreductase (luciferase family)